MEVWRNELYHHGIKGQKWGIRRYQNEDGTLTEKGKKRYAIAEKRLNNREKYITKRYSVDRLASRLGTAHNIMNAGRVDSDVKRVRDLNSNIKSSEERMLKLANKSMRQRIATGTVGTAAALGSAFVAASATGSLVVAALPAAAIAAGAAYVGHLTHR